MDGLATIARPFGLEGAAKPEEPAAGANLSARCSLTRLLGTPIASADAIYAYRADSLRAPTYAPDDIFNLDFNAKRISAEQYEALVAEYLLVYIRSFSSYQASLGAEDPFLERSQDAEMRGRPIRFIRLVNFWDEKLIAAAFGKTLDQARSLLQPHAYRVEVLNGGIYSVLSERAVPPNEQWLLHEKLWQLMSA